MGGHLFVLWGDLTQLHCSAVLVPCDSEWRVVAAHWREILPEGSLDAANGAGWARFNPRGTGRFTDAVKDGDKWVRLVVTADDHRDDSPTEAAQWVAEGVVEAIRDLSINRLPTPTGRVKALIGVPLVGTGAGGFEGTRGTLIHALIPELQKAARDFDVDIALVLKDERDYAAVQAVRKGYWDEFRNEQPGMVKHLDTADRLGHQAAQGQLSLFLGSGVSVPLGVPNWRELLSTAGRRNIRRFNPENAPRIAQRIEETYSRSALTQAIENSVKVPGVAPTHLLLAALSVRQTVTTNYDTAYERALDVTLGKGEYRVFTKQLALQPHPWVLKLHGCVDRPNTIVITTEDYKKLRRDHGALHAVVESLMMTSHLMFVGFSMGDPNFLAAANRVRAVRELADEKHSLTVATVLALDPRAVVEHTDFETVYMLDNEDPREAARVLEIFLDRVAWRATTAGPASSTYLLDPAYQDLFKDDASITKLREKLSTLVDDIGVHSPAWSHPGWEQVAKLLSQLGDDRFTEK